MGRLDETAIAYPEGGVPQNAFARIRSQLPGLAASEARVARWVLDHADQVVYWSMARVAEECEVSDTTVLRFCRSVGFHGYTELKISLVRDLASPTQAINRDICSGDDPYKIACVVFQSHIQALQDTLAVLDAQALGRAIGMLNSARHVLIVGVGTSGPIVHDMRNKLFRLGISCEAETDSYLQLMRTALLGPEDLVVAISQSGSSVDPVLTLKEARKHGVPTLCITGNAKSPLTEYADVTLLGISSEMRAETIASRIAQATLVDVLYVSLFLLDVSKADRNERQIWDAVIPKSI